MKTRQAISFHDRDEHAHVSDKFCGPCFMNSALVFITTQWPLTLLFLVIIAALVYYL